MKKFDLYLKTVDKKQKYMLYGIFFICIFFVFKEIVPPMLEKQNNLLDNISRLENEIEKNSISKLKKQLTLKNNEVLKQTEAVEVKKEDIDFLMSSIYKIKYLSLSDINWANRLDDILKFSIEKDLRITSLKNFNVLDDASNLIKHKRTIQISGIGEYQNIVAYIQYIENFNVLVEFKNITLTLVNDHVEFDFEVNMYGIGL